MGDGIYEIIVVGTSLGGLHALEVMLGGLPKSFLLPIAIAQHRHKNSDDSLSDALQRNCALPVREPEDKEAIVPGRVYLASGIGRIYVGQGGRHLLCQLKLPCCMPDPRLMCYSSQLPTPMAKKC
jgi:two-component system, chemotaxis family, protein-glutamate methylesterase/glutaminase